MRPTLFDPASEAVIDACAAGLLLAAVLRGLVLPLVLGLIPRRR